MLMLRAFIASITINSIAWYIATGNIELFNVSISAWCFMEWMAVFQNTDRSDILDWLLPPLNQLCLLVRVFATEVNKMI